MFEQLKLDRPLVVFDIESTGVVPQRDRIVEIAVLKVMPDGETRSTVRRLNPQMPIPPSATAIHGISDADVAACPVFADIADKAHAEKPPSSGAVSSYKSAFVRYSSSGVIKPLVIGVGKSLPENRRISYVFPLAFAVSNEST